MCTVNIRGHEANFYEARCHEAEIEARRSEAEAEWFGLDATKGHMGLEAEWFGLEAITSLVCNVYCCALAQQYKQGCLRSHMKSVFIIQRPSKYLKSLGLHVTCHHWKYNFGLLLFLKADAYTFVQTISTCVHLFVSSVSAPHFASFIKTGHVTSNEVIYYAVLPAAATFTYIWTFQ